MRIEENKFLRNYLMYYGKWKKKIIFVILLIFPNSGNNWKKKNSFMMKNEKNFRNRKKFLMGYCPFVDWAGAGARGVRWARTERAGDRAWARGRGRR